MWITIDDLKENYGEFDLPKTKDETGAKVIDTDKINECIGWGENYFKGNFEAINIDTSLFTDTQVNEFKMYLLDVVRYYYSNKDLKNSGEIRTRFEHAKEWIKSVKNGDIKLITINQTEKINNKGFASVKLIRS